MGDYCRRMKGRLGKTEGHTAVAHKLARIIFAMIQTQAPYKPSNAFKTTIKSRSKRLKGLQKAAKSLNIQLVPIR